MISFIPSRHRSNQFRKLFIIIIAWLVVAFFISCYDHFCLISDLSLGPNTSYSFSKTLVFNLSAGLIGSLFGGAWLIFYVNEKLINKPYGYTLLAVGLFFIMIVAVIAVVLGLIFVRLETGSWPFTEQIATERFYKNLTNPFHLKNLIVWANITLLTQFALQVNDKFGQGLLWDFIRGKYQTPQKEKRIFMFLDITSSTAIAEKLGNSDYYKFIRDFYADITFSILNNGGIIYQYVGDEVVVSWPCQDTERDALSLNCYFDIRKKIDSLKDKYQQQFGVVPDFKAALHYGEVTAGEIGVIKKDITYSGDVLNTTARILSKCNIYQQKLLVSGKLYEYLQNYSSLFQFSKMGEDQLRGKSSLVSIYAVTN